MTENKECTLEKIPNKYAGVLKIVAYWRDFGIQPNLIWHKECNSYHLKNKPIKENKDKTHGKATRIIGDKFKHRYSGSDQL